MRKVKYRKDVIGLWLVILLILSFFLVNKAMAAERTHHVVYVVTNSSGDAVSTQTVRVKVKRLSDDRTFDFSDNTFKLSPTTSLATMAYNSSGEYYARSITVDTGRMISGDYAFIVSNDDATYGDQQAEIVYIDNTNDIIRIHR